MKSTARSVSIRRSLVPRNTIERTLVIDGFSKSHGMTGWRLGYVHGPAEIIDTMIKLQQYTFVCARSRCNGPAPWRWMCRWTGTLPITGGSGT